MFTKIKILKSSDENVMKYIFEKSDALIEAVLYKYPTFEERTVICCSVMCGCPVGCRFCGTGNYFVRNLKAEEIIYQIDHCLESQNIDASKIKKFQIMFMSQGEGMLNYKELEKAIEILYIKYPHAKLLISTTGPDIDYEPLMLLSERIPTIGLQFSVHESTDEKRDLLIPFKAKLNLEQISFIGEMFLGRTGRKPFFNYCANDNNSSLEDAQRLSEIFDPIVFEATISVICENDETISAAHKRQQELANTFQNHLLNFGYSTRMFDPDDTGSGCGQLWAVQEWMKNNPDKAKPSIGFNLPKIHSPK